MQSLSCLIVDDEPLALELIEGYVMKTPFLQLKGKCSSAFEAMRVLMTEKVDLIFLDIQMPDMNGVDFSKTLASDIKIIFTTAFKDYAFEGFKVNAVDYLLKPFNYAEFLKASHKVLERMNVPDMAAGKQYHDNFIFVKSEYKQIKINLDEVLYFEGLKDYVKIWTNTLPKPILTLMSLKTLEQELSSKKFMRIHRSFIVALDKIESIERSQVILNKERITVAEQYKEKFQEFLDQRSFH